MKRYIFTLVLACSLTAGASAQNRSIEFEATKSWAEITEKATAADKLIFIDCYTDWCGPCKMLSAQVFTRDNVADYFNETFVNVKYNMEKDRDAMARAEEWGITGYPTLLFIDPASGRVVKKLVGAGKAEWLIAGGEDAIKVHGKLPAMIERYNNGNIGPRFMAEFIPMLDQAGMEKEREQIFATYFASLTPEEMATADHWQLLMAYADDPVSEPLKTVIENRELFYDIPGENQQQAVNGKISTATVNAAIEFAANPNLMMWDGDRFAAFVDFLETIEGPVKEISAIWLNTSIKAQKGQWGDLLATMKAVESEQLLPMQHLQQYLGMFCTKLGESGESKTINETIKWLDSRVTETSGDDLQSLYARALATEAKLHLAQAAGRTSLIQKAEKELRKYIEQINAKTAEQQQ